MYRRKARFFYFAKAHKAEARNERIYMVFVLNRSKKPLDMISHAEARILLRKKLAVIHKVYPFTIRLRDNSCVGRNKAYTVKIDPRCVK